MVATIQNEYLLHITINLYPQWFGLGDVIDANIQIKEICLLQILEEMFEFYFLYVRKLKKIEYMTFCPSYEYQ